MKDLISVVVPIYNVERFLPICIESIISQSYKKLQIILVDDGSTDNCGNICNEYASRDERVEVIHKQNGGLSDARNVGIERAKGKYITFVDSDDVIALDMIEYLYELIIENKADMSVCQRKDIDENGKNIYSNKTVLGENYILNGNNMCMYNFLSKKDISVTAWGKLYSSNLFCNIRYPLKKYHEDVFTTYKLVGLCELIVVGAAQKYFYRQRSGSIMAQVFSIKHLDLIEARIEESKYIEKNYPLYVNLGYASIIYSVNMCIYRMGVSHCVDKNYIEYFKYLYSSYLHFFLCYRNYKFSSKIFSIICKLNISLVLYFLSMKKN